jgi:DNA-binding MarR family transcriptional regulator
MTRIRRLSPTLAALRLWGLRPESVRPAWQTTATATPLKRLCLDKNCRDNYNGSVIQPHHAPANQRDADLDRSIMHLLFEVARHLATAIDRRMAAFNLTGQQAALLLRCCAQPNLTPSQLAPGLGTDNAGITRLLDRLEGKGLVERRMSPADRRAVVIEPTDAGREIFPELSTALREVVAQLLAGFEANELPALHSLLRRLLDNVEGREP